MTKSNKDSVSTVFEQFLKNPRMITIGQSDVIDAAEIARVQYEKHLGVASKSGLLIYLKGNADPISVVMSHDQMEQFARNYSMSIGKSTLGR